MMSSFDVSHHSGARGGRVVVVLGNIFFQWKWNCVHATDCFINYSVDMAFSSLFCQRTMQHDYRSVSGSHGWYVQHMARHRFASGTPGSLVLIFTFFLLYI